MPRVRPAIFRSPRAGSRAALLAIATFGTACQKPTATAALPTADAGEDRLVPLGSSVTLDGSGSTTGAGATTGLTYTWSVASMPSGSAATLTGADTASPSFIADAAGDFLLALVVHEAGRTSRPDVVVVQARAALSIIGQSPPNRASNVPSTQPVVLEFSEPLQPESIGSDAVAVIDADTIVPTAVALSDGNSVVVLTPIAPWPANRELVVQVTMRVVALSGRSLDAGYRASFSSSAAADTRAPRLRRLEPADGATGVSTAAAVVADFDEPLDAFSATTDATSDGCPDNVRVEAAAVCVQGTVQLSAGGTRLTFLPNAPLAGGTTYTVTLGSGVGGLADAAGNTVAATPSTSFTVTGAADTTPPTIVAVYPDDGYTGVPIGVTLTVTFSEPMDASLSGGAQLGRVAGASVSTTSSWSTGNRVVTIRPASLLAAGADFNLVLTGGALGFADRAGNSLDADDDGQAGGGRTVQFSTIATPTVSGGLTVPPSLVPGASLSLRVTDRDLDVTSNPDTVTVEVESSTGELEHVVLTETAAASGIFDDPLTTLLTTSAGANDDGVLHTEVGDVLTVRYMDDATAAGVPALILATVPVIPSGAGFVAGALSAPGYVTEAEGAITFTLVLTTQPTANVQVQLASGDPTEGTAAPPTLTFTSSNWNTPQTVTVTGVDDPDIDGNQTFMVAFGPTTSTDNAYAAVRPNDIAVVNRDNDSAGIVLGVPSGNTSETGSVATFTVALRSRPVDDVEVQLASDDTTEGDIAPTSVTFTSTTWDTAQVVTVTGQNDALNDDDVTYHVDVTTIVSTDTDYAALTPLPRVTLINLDDDGVGFVLGAVSGPTRETGRVATFSIALSAQPTASVTLDFDSPSSTEGELLWTSLVFTTLDWATPQLLAVAGVDDDLDDNDRMFSIECIGSTSADTQYAAITPADVVFINEDDDAVGFVLGPVSGPTTEAGGVATFTLALTSRPASDVVLILSSTDSNEGNPDGPSSFPSFPAASWSTPQLMTIVGADDASPDGSRSYSIDILGTGAYSAASSSVALLSIDDESGCEAVVVNELVTAPTADWSDTTAGEGTPFDATPGKAAPTTGDEWIELVNTGCLVDLSGWTLVLTDATPYTYTFGTTNDGQTLAFSAGGSVTAFAPGEVLLIGAPAGGSNSLDDDLWVHLHDDTAALIDGVGLGTSAADGSAADNAPAGNTSDSVARVPNGADTDTDAVDFLAGDATPRTNNDCRGIAAIAVDASASGSDTDGSLTWNHTTSGLARLLVVTVAVQGSAEATAVTYGASPLSRLGFVGEGTTQRVETWWLVAPALGTSAVNVTLSAAEPATAGSVSLTGAKQTGAAPISTFASGTSFWASVTPTPTTAGSLAIDVLAFGAGTPSVGPRQTQRWSEVGGRTSSEGPQRSTAPMLLDWRFAGATTWALGAVLVAPQCL